MPSGGRDTFAAMQAAQLTSAPALGAPTQADQVRAAFRLGWAVSELRGRFRPERFLQPDPVPAGQVKFQRPDWELAMSVERSPTELRIEVMSAVEGLIQILTLDVSTPLKSVGESAFQLNQQGADISGGFLGFAKKLYDLDAQIQDELVVRGSEAAAYQLGRGLADNYWMLYPDRPQNEMGSWANLLGEQRYHALVRQALRLSPEIGPLVLAAIGGPLQQWHELAADESRRSASEVVPALHDQGLLWRDLIRGERQPGDLAQPRAKDVWADLKLYRAVFLALRVPILVGLAAAGLLALGAALLASHNANSGLSTAISVIGVLGITSAGLYARAKAELTALLANVRQAVQLERVRRAANLCPAPPQPPPRQLAETNNSRGTSSAS